MSSNLAGAVRTVLVFTAGVLLVDLFARIARRQFDGASFALHALATVVGVGIGVGLVFLLLRRQVSQGRIALLSWPVAFAGGLAVGLLEIVMGYAGR